MRELYPTQDKLKQMAQENNRMLVEQHRQGYTETSIEYESRLRYEIEQLRASNAQLREALHNTLVQAAIFNRDGDIVWDAVKEQALNALK